MKWQIRENDKMRIFTLAKALGNITQSDKKTGESTILAQIYVCVNN
jgi:hypothetical protein